MNKKVSEFVRKYVEEHLDKSDPKQEFEVFVVWQCYILGNAKWLLSTTLPDERYSPLMERMLSKMILVICTTIMLKMQSLMLVPICTLTQSHQQRKY